MDSQLHHLRHCYSPKLGKQRQAEVDTGSNSSTGEAISIVNYPVFLNVDAKGAQDIQVGPVACGFIAVQKTSRSEQE